MKKERRQTENSQFRRHVDVLFSLIHARDEIWSAGIFCRIFNPVEFRRRIVAYDRAAVAMRRSILEIQQLLTKENFSEGKTGTVLTPDELKILLGRPQNNRS